MNWWRLLGLVSVFVPWLLIAGTVHIVKVVWETPAEKFLALESPHYLPVIAAGVRGADQK